MNQELKVDICVIGAGSGGLSVAALGEPNADDPQLPVVVDPAWA